MNNTMKDIVEAILGNEKRVAKIKTCSGSKYVKARQYVVGECATRKVTLCTADIVRCVAEIINGIKER